MVLEQGQLIFPEESQYLNRLEQLPRPITEGDVPLLMRSRTPRSVNLLDVENGRVITRQMPRRR